MAQVIKPAISHEDHNSEVMTLDTFSLMQWRRKVTQLYNLMCALIKDLNAGEGGTWEAVFQSLAWLTGCVPTWKPRATPGLLGMGPADSQQNFGKKPAFVSLPCQSANGREQPWGSRFFLTLASVVNESLCRFKHYTISYIRKKKCSPVLRSTVNRRKII